MVKHLQKRFPDQSFGWGQKKMKWLLSCFMVIAFALPSVSVTASGVGVSQPEASLFDEQSGAEKALILQKCIDLAELQPFYAKDANGNFKQLTVMQHGISFASGMAVAHAGKAVAFVSKEQIKGAGLDAFFYFHEFQINGNTARVDYAYNYDQTTASPKMQVVSLQLQKSTTGWAIVSSKVEGR